MEFLLEHCQILIDTHGGLLFSLFLAGLTGGVSHCAGMCGPFVMAQVSSNMGHVTCDQFTRLTRLKGAGLLPYHFGRMTTYTILGAVSAYFTMQLTGYAVFKWIAASLLFLAICIFLASIMSKVKFGLFDVNVFAFLPKAKVVRNMMKDPRRWRGYILGVCLGFIPCGLVYAAIMVVASSGDVVLAVVGMMIFSLGTIPGLILVGLGASFAPKSRQGVLKYFIPMLLVTNSIILLYTIKELF